MFLLKNLFRFLIFKINFYSCDIEIKILPAGVTKMITKKASELLSYGCTNSINTTTYREIPFERNPETK